MIYISGAVTNNPNYKQEFAEAEIRLKKAGYKEIINPVKIMANLPPETPYKVYMDLSLFLLRDCSEVYMLDGWKNSKGARLEHEYAECAGMKILYEKDEVKEKKYYWRLKNFCNKYNYLNYQSCDNIILIHDSRDSKETETQFTENKYKELSRRFCFPEDMFVKEEILDEN